MLGTDKSAFELCFAGKFIRTNFDRLRGLFSLINLWLCANRWLISISRRFFRQHIFKFKAIAPYLSGVSYRYFCLAQLDLTLGIVKGKHVDMSVLTIKNSLANDAFCDHFRVDV